MQFLYLRAVTGCEDGRIRIWNVLNGQCIRIIRGNSRSDPILNLIANGDTIVINTVSNILALQFEPVSWIYHSDAEKTNELDNRSSTRNVQEKVHLNCKSQSFRHVNQRCERSRFAGNIDPRIFLTPTTDCEKASSEKQRNNSRFFNLRSFENGERLTRLSTWIVSPTLNKTFK